MTVEKQTDRVRRPDILASCRSLPTVVGAFVAEFVMRNWPAAGGEIGNRQSPHSTIDNRHSTIV